MKLNTRLRELFVANTKEPIKIGLLASKLNIKKASVYSLIRSMRKEGYVIWSINTGTDWLILTKKVAKPKRTIDNIKALLANDWYTVREIADLLYKDWTTINAHIKRLDVDTKLLNVQHLGMVKHYKLKRGNHD